MFCKAALRIYCCLFNIFQKQRLTEVDFDLLEWNAKYNRWLFHWAYKTQQLINEIVPTDSLLSLIGTKLNLSDFIVFSNC